MPRGIETARSVQLKEISPITEAQIRGLLSDYADGLGYLLENASLYGVPVSSHFRKHVDLVDVLHSHSGESKIIRRVLGILGQEVAARSVYESELRDYLERTNSNPVRQDNPDHRRQIAAVSETLALMSAEERVGGLVRTT